MLLSQRFMMNHFIHSHVVIQGEDLAAFEGWGSAVQGYMADDKRLQVLPGCRAVGALFWIFKIGG